MNLQQQIPGLRLKFFFLFAIFLVCSNRKEQDGTVLFVDGYSFLLVNDYRNIKSCNSRRVTRPSSAAFKYPTKSIITCSNINHNKNCLQTVLGSASRSNAEVESLLSEASEATKDDDENISDNDIKAVLSSTSAENESSEEEDNNIIAERERYRYVGNNGYNVISGHSRYLNSLSRHDKKKNLIAKEANEDGYEDIMKQPRRSFWRRVLKLPLKAAKMALLSLKTKKLTTKTSVKTPGTLILVRHGESTWNANKIFTGWADPDLSEKGYREVEHAARLLLEGGYEIDVVFTSRLKRAIRSTWIILEELNEIYVPVFKSWRLNERMYGALTGLSKVDTAEQLGTDLVQQWRSSLKSRPPAMKASSKYWPGKKRKYADLSTDEIPLTESLEDCMERTTPVLENKILNEIRKGNNVMVVAHANTLRGLVKVIDGIGVDEIQEVSIPTGIPIVYKFDLNPNNNNDLQVIDVSGTSFKNSNNETDTTMTNIHMKGLFLEKPGLLKEALKMEDSWRWNVPGYDSTMTRTNTPMTTLERSLFKLKAERELGEWAVQFIDPNAEYEDNGDDGYVEKPKQPSGGDDVTDISTNQNYDVNVTSTMVEASLSDQILEDEEEDEEVIETISAANILSQPCVVGLDPSLSKDSDGNDTPVDENERKNSVFVAPTPRKNPSIVIIRHGKTDNNKLGLFTGWEDVPLAQDGINEARAAGKLLKSHGFEFDVVYTSWLTRAIGTAWYVMDELDCLWLPIIKSWRLNERMYGELTGLSKRMVAQRHGETQFKAWRRGFKVKPPKVSSFSQHYPGNDRRYQRYLTDIRLSARESIIRSIEKGEISLHRKFPKSESLKDCMDRTIPFFTERIMPQAVDQGKRVLISSSENAIRGLLMHLCDIPEEKITDLEIPNGLPLVFDVKTKCLKLLDDGTGRDPLETYNFGKAAPYLFKPCEDEDGSPDEECMINFLKPSAVELTDKDKEAFAAITKKTSKEQK